MHVRYLYTYVDQHTGITHDSELLNADFRSVLSGRVRELREQNLEGVSTTGLCVPLPTGTAPAAVTPH